MKKGREKGKIVERKKKLRRKEEDYRKTEAKRK
jgi:hypothetical protein